jgi:hypothetical protein
MELIINKPEEPFIDIDDYNNLFRPTFGPKISLNPYKLDFNKSSDTLDDLDYNSLFNSIEAISSKSESQNNSMEENKEIDYITTEKTKIRKFDTNDSMGDKTNCFGCKSKKRLKTFDSYYSTNVNNTKRSSNFSKSIKLNDSLTKFRKRKNIKAPTVKCGCVII